MAYHTVYDISSLKSELQYMKNRLRDFDEIITDSMILLTELDDTIDKNIKKHLIEQYEKERL